MMKPKKSLGQNFLKDREVLKKIIQAAELKADDLVIEIGPGEGVLTEELIRYARKVIAIEIDKNLAEKLKKKFGNYRNLEIINDDILKINLPEILERVETRQCLVSTCPYKLIANIPFYITSPIIQLFLETQYPPAEMILTVQKEVAERIVARPGKMSILSVSVQYYAQVELLFYVDRKSFWPIPEVDSAAIRITPFTSANLTPDLLPYKGEKNKKFFRVVRAGFSAKRKMLVNNLSNGFHLDKKTVEEKLKTAGIEPTVRAQELSIADWKKISILF